MRGLIGHTCPTSQFWPRLTLGKSCLGKFTWELGKFTEYLTTCSNYCALHVLRFPDEMGITKFYLCFTDGKMEALKG